MDECDGGPVRPGSYVRITLADTGRGIEEEYLPKIFDPYFTTKATGTGLGLATVHSIVSRHGGFLLVDSRLGEGTVFTIYLPALKSETVAAPSPEPAPAVAAAGDFAGSRVLIMDDDPEIRQLLAELLHQEGYRTMAVADGQAAIREYRAALERGEKFACLIMDLTIPGGMGGREAIGRIREIDPAAKAIVSSGYSNDPVMANFTDYGFAGRVAKPYQLEELVRVFREVLGG